MGFEPTVFYNTPVFKTGTLSRSVIHPIKKIFMSKNYILFNHLEELKYRFLYILISFIFSFISFYFFLGEITYLIIKPLTLNNSKIHELIYTDMSEAFFASIKLSISFTIIVIIPIILYHLYFFFLPGMYKKKKNKVFKYIIVSITLMYISLLFVYNFFIPIVWDFFLNYDFNLNNNLFRISFEGKIIEYVNLVTNIFFTFIFCFQFPLIFFIFLKLKLISTNNLKKYRSLNIVFCFILGALFSPPDVISQILIAIPLCFMYELNIIFSLYLSNLEGYLENT